MSAVPDMQLKTYQHNALDQLDRWLDALRDARLKCEKATQALEESGFDVPDALKNSPLSAWKSLKEQSVLPTVQSQDGSSEVPDYISRTATSGEPVPHVCLKVPTGGGKTLLGVAALERIKQDTGFVLWIVPTRAIYEQTLRTFRIREIRTGKCLSGFLAARSSCCRRTSVSPSRTLPAGCVS